MAPSKITVTVQFRPEHESRHAGLVPAYWHAEVTGGMRHVARAMNAGRPVSRPSRYYLYYDGDSRDEAVEGITAELERLGISARRVRFEDVPAGVRLPV